MARPPFTVWTVSLLGRCTLRPGKGVKMKVKEIIDIYGKKCQIDEKTKKLYYYNNAEKRIVYNAQIIEDGKNSLFWATYEEPGTVDNIADRLNAWNNAILLVYSESVGFNAPKNDPDRQKWQKVVEFVKAHEDKIFTKSGDFRKKYLIDLEKIRKIIDV